MAVMLRFLGQASKQTTTHLLPPSAMTPKRLAVGGATPRTPKTPANDASPFFPGQCSPRAFFNNSEHELPAPPQPAPPANLMMPVPLGFGLPPQAEPCSEVEPDSPESWVDAKDTPSDSLFLKSAVAEAAEEDRDAFFLKSSPRAAAAGDSSSGTNCSAEGNIPGPNERTPVKSSGLPVLLGRQRLNSAMLKEESKLKCHAPEAERAREAFLARQMRIAGRRPPPDPTDSHAPVTEADLARATREAFLSRQSTIAGRRLLARA
uniref:Uncharacterized protein n=1 Tax=Alexandrium monilatum TaxID=311494 RepID=A0A6T1JQB5_9DINO|mmetsp:Transcript_27671/g.82585  ORF Transcript_27671/g.82585 Transcript_27671/m.82585 type:complete len:263 (+) Transcript_27671:79-867(+)